VFAKPLIRSLELPSLIDHPVNPVKQRLRLNIAVEIHLQQMQERRIDLHLIHQPQLELILRRTQRPKRRLPQQHRRARLPRPASVLPSRQPAPE